MDLVLIGPHGVGKTTLGRALAADLAIPFHPELGRQMAEDPAWRPAGQTASVPMVSFDAELLRRELARDRGSVGPRIVETWHIGNLAYAIRRSPELTSAFLAAIRRPRPVVVQPLLAQPPALARRQTEPGDQAFFLQVGREAIRLAEALGMTVLPPVWTDRETPRRCVAQIRAGLSAHGVCLRPSLPQGA